MNSDNRLTYSHGCHTLAWKPIIAGALIAVGLSFLLNVFAIAISLTAFSVDNSGAEVLAFGGLLGTAIGIVASMFAAGWITGYLAKHCCPDRHLGAVYGFLTWCVALIVTIFLASDAHQYMIFYGHFLSGHPDIAQIATNITPADAVATPSINAITVSAYVIFSLFFLSAISCGIGGHCGMRSRWEKMD